MQEEAGGDAPAALSCAQSDRSAWVGFVRTLRVFALAARSSGASCGMEGGRFVCRKKNSHQEGIKLKRPFGEASSQVVTSCSSYFCFPHSVICAGLTHPVTVSSAQMVLHGPLMPCTIWVNYGSETLGAAPARGVS